MRRLINHNEYKRVAPVDDARRAVCARALAVSYEGSLTDRSFDDLVTYGRRTTASIHAQVYFGSELQAIRRLCYAIGRSIS